MKTRTHTLFTFFVLLSSLIGVGSAATLYVGGGGYSTIQTAINAAATSGDEIEVAPGTYNEAINFNGKPVRLYSSGGPEATIIDGTGNYHVVQCISGEDPNTIIEGFTITGGDANGPILDDRLGGGMFNYAASPTVTNCIFIENAAIHGGGMYNNQSKNDYSP